MSELTMSELPPHGREQAAPPLTARMLATNAGLALLALVALFLALLRGDAERNTALLVLGGLAFVPALWVFTTGVAALRKAEIDAQTLLERHAVLVIFAVLALTVARLVWLLGAQLEGEPAWFHHLVGAQTVLVYYSARLHAATRRPPLARLHPMATVGVVASVLIELGVILRLVWALPG